MNNEKLIINGSDVVLSWDDIPSDMREDLSDCSHQGQCDDDVEYFINKYHNRLEYDPEDLKKYLSGYGAWDDVELSDTVANLCRVVWIIAGDLNEHEQCYLSAY